METKNGFTLFKREEFLPWLLEQKVHRVITNAQQHHTYIPGYQHFDGKNHFDRLTGMKNFHVNQNGWSDIAQNITTFPDGTIAMCRSLDSSPAGIRGANASGICIEHFGNFDIGGDEMSAEHRATIIHLNAALCLKFKMLPDSESLIYHHWYDLGSGHRLNGEGSTKSCPGTNFFGGNKVPDAEKGFIPLVVEEFKRLGGKYEKPPQPIGSAYINVPKLNVRGAADAAGEIVSQLPQSTLVDFFEEKNGYVKIDDDEERWVDTKYIIKVKHGRINAPGGLNVRVGPAATFTKLSSIPHNEKVTVFEEKDGWSRIDWNEKWVSSEYVKQS